VCPGCVACFELSSFILSHGYIIYILRLNFTQFALCTIYCIDLVYIYISDFACPYHRHVGYVVCEKVKQKQPKVPEEEFIERLINKEREEKAWICCVRMGEYRIPRKNS
jgi:hypothetical protein